MSKKKIPGDIYDTVYDILHEKRRALREESEHRAAEQVLRAIEWFERETEKEGDSRKPLQSTL